MTLPYSDCDVLLLHNPACSKCRAVKVLLDREDIPYTEQLYLEEPLSRSELNDLLVRLDRPVRDWIRIGEKAFAEAGLSLGSPEDDLLDALVEHPELMQRPIVVRGLEAMLGRPPEAILELFDD